MIGSMTISTTSPMHSSIASNAATSRPRSTPRIPPVPSAATVCVASTTPRLGNWVAGRSTQTPTREARREFATFDGTSRRHADAPASSVLQESAKRLRRRRTPTTQRRPARLSGPSSAVAGERPTQAAFQCCRHTSRAIDRRFRQATAPWNATWPALCSAMARRRQGFVPSHPVQRHTQTSAA